jgi:hypothetical protein
MIIIDDLFNKQQIDELRASINKDIQTHGGKFGKYEFNEEVDHHETQESGLFHLQHDTRDLYLRFLVDKKIFSDECLSGYDHTLRYHEMKSPYYSTWHKDRLADWDGDEVDYIGVSYFMNDEWNYEDGGLFLYKKNKESSVGNYVIPIGNRIIINDEDLYHAVTQITNPEIIRISLQLFIHKKYLIT